LVPDLEEAVGHGHVRLMGQRGTTARLDESLTSPQSPEKEDSTACRTAIVAEADLDDTNVEETDDF